MEVKIIKLLKSDIELKIEVPAQEWQEFLDEAVKDLSKDLKIEGFRPGYAPFKIVEEKIGLVKILEKAAENCVKKCYVRAILENNIEAIGQPEISILKMAKGNPFEFKAKATIMPEVKLPDYKKIASEVQRNKVLVEDKEIAEALSWLQKSRAKFISKTDVCQKGDWVEIKLKINPPANGEKLKIDEPETKDAFFLGQGSLIPGLEEKLEGMLAGQEKEFSLVFPENHYRKDLVGKEVNLKVQMVSVQKVEFPEINDQLARNLGRFESLADLKKNLREKINLEKEMIESQRIRQDILEKISQDSQLEVPEVLIKNEQSQMLEIFKKDLSQRLKMTLEDYLNKIEKTEKELLDSFFLEAQKRIKNALILKEISKKEKIEVAEEEIETEANKILKRKPEVRKLDPEKLKDYAKEGLKSEKTLAKLESFVRN